MKICDPESVRVNRSSERNRLVVALFAVLCSANQSALFWIMKDELKNIRKTALRAATG